MWMTIWGGRGKKVLYICCVYMPTDSSSIEERYASLKEDVLAFKQKGRIVLQWREGLILNLLMGVNRILVIIRALLFLV